MVELLHILAYCLFRYLDNNQTPHIAPLSELTGNFLVGRSGNEAEQLNVVSLLHVLLAFERCASVNLEPSPYCLVLPGLLHILELDSVVSLAKRNGNRPELLDFPGDS